MQREHVSSGTPWEAVAGYARAVRVGAHIAVVGTTATNAQGEVVAPGDAYAQTVHALRNIQAALQELGADMPDGG